MGQKVHPVGIRLAIAGYERKITSFPARKKDLVLQTSENIQVMEFIKKHYKQAGIGQVKIDRPGNQVNVRIFCAKPGLLIGHRGGDVEKIRRQITVLLQGKTSVSVIEIKKLDLEAKLVAESIAASLERRVSFRKAMKKAVQSTMRAEPRALRYLLQGVCLGLRLQELKDIKKAGCHYTR